MTRDERGAAALEFVIIVPALLLIVGFLVAGGRLANARAVVTGAAESGSRAASVSRTAALAQANARNLVAAETAGLPCAGGPRVRVDTSGFSVAVGRPASVGVGVTCVVPLDGLVPGLPGSVAVRAESESVLDRYRGRS